MKRLPGRIRLNGQASPIAMVRPRVWSEFALAHVASEGSSLRPWIWLWLPLVRTKYPPSDSIILMTSRTELL